MKNFRYLFLALIGTFLISSCNDNDVVPSNPVMESKADFGSAMFGDSLPFTVELSDADVSTFNIKGTVVFGDEKVSETVIQPRLTPIIQVKFYSLLCRYSQWNSYSEIGLAKH